MTEEKIKSYALLLSDIDDEEALEEAFLKAGRECAWFPSVAEIRERLPDFYVDRKRRERIRKSLAVAE